MCIFTNCFTGRLMTIFYILTNGKDWVRLNEKLNINELEKLTNNVFIRDTTNHPLPQLCLMEEMLMSSGETTYVCSTVGTVWQCGLVSCNCSITYEYEYV